jgi:CRP-like cAMP-binding protein
MEKLDEREYLKAFKALNLKNPNVKTEEIIKILGKEEEKRTEQDKVVLFGCLLKFKFLKKFSQMVHKKDFLDFLNKFTAHYYAKGEVLYHIGGQAEPTQYAYFVLEGKVNLYNFRTIDVNIA